MMKSVICLTFIFSGAIASANYKAPAKTTLKTAPKLMAPVKRLSFEVGYSGLTDMLETREKTISHTLSFSGTYIWSKNLSLGGFAEFEYESIGRDIVNENQPSDQPGIGDVGMYANQNISLGSDLGLNASYSFILPTSQISRDEGYKGIFSTKATIPYDWNNLRTTITNTVGLSYIANTFENSILAGTPSPDYTVNYSLGARYKISKAWAAGGSVDVRSTHFIDNFNRFRAGNSLFIAYNYSNWSSRLTYSNGVIPDRINSSNPALDSFQIMQIDQYRQIVGWDLSCSF